MTKAYTIAEHQHRLAAWAASRAASVKGCRFKVQDGVKILEVCGFDARFSRTRGLPTSKRFDRQHERWRKAIIRAAKGQRLKFTHGVAAKLLNIYLKTRFTCGGYHTHPRVKCLHPPIDDLLLAELAARNFGGFAKQWRKFRRLRWSKFKSAHYQNAIDHIRKSLLKREPLWMIEVHWRGHQ